MRTLACVLPAAASPAQPGLAQHLTIPLFGSRPSKKGNAHSNARDGEGEEDDVDDVDSQYHAGSAAGKSGGSRWAGLGGRGVLRLRWRRPLAALGKGRALSGPGCVHGRKLGVQQRRESCRVCRRAQGQVHNREGRSGGPVGQRGAGASGCNLHLLPARPVPHTPFHDVCALFSLPVGLGVAAQATSMCVCALCVCSVCFG